MLPVPVDHRLEPEFCALAACHPWRNGDCEIRLADRTEDDPGYDGYAFSEQYRKAKYP